MRNSSHFCFSDLFIFKINKLKTIFLTSNATENPSFPEESFYILHTNADSTVSFWFFMFSKKYLLLSSLLLSKGWWKYNHRLVAKAFTSVEKALAALPVPSLAATEKHNNSLQRALGSKMRDHTGLWDIGSLGWILLKLF